MSTAVDAGVEGVIVLLVAGVVSEIKRGSDAVDEGEDDGDAEDAAEGIELTVVVVVVGTGTT